MAVAEQTTYKKKYYENNKILLFPDKERKIETIEKYLVNIVGNS